MSAAEASEVARPPPPKSATVRFGRLELWVLATPSPASGWPPGSSAATWVYDDGDEVTMFGWFVPANA